MNKVSQKILLVLFISYILGFLFFLSYSLFFSPSVKILDSMNMEWMFLNSFILFISALIPIHCTAILLAYSLIISVDDISGGTVGGLPFYRLINVTLVLFLLLSLVYTLIIAIFQPSAIRKKTQIEYQSVMAGEYKEQAEAAAAGGNYARAVNYTEHYLAIDEENKEMLDNLDEYRDKLFLQPEEETGKEEAGIEDADRLDLSAGGLFEKAQNYFDEQNYFSAHYYASLAADLEPEWYEAKRLANRAWTMMQEHDDSISEQRAREFYERKREAYEALVQEDPIKSYYIFSDLAQENPKDKDIQTYLPQTLKKLEEISFFHEDAFSNQTLPGITDILFLNDYRDDAREILYFGKMVQVQKGTYFYDIEVMRFTPEGEIIYHLSAPYGKLIEQHINMHCIDRKSPEIQYEYLPSYHVGTRPEELRYIVQLRLPLSDLETIAVASRSYKQANIAALFRILQFPQNYGFAREPVLLELDIRLVLPFSFVILSFFFMGFGWKYRSKYLSRPPILSFVFVPVIPFVIYFLYEFYIHAFRLISGFFLSYSSFVVSLIIVIALQAILFILTLLYLAGQITE